MRGDLVDIPGLEIHEELGRGGQCVVFRASRNGESYALKVPLLAETEAARRHHAQRFRREAVARARAAHPGIPDVLELGEREGVPYLLLELGQGETLGARLARGPLSEREALSVGRSVAEALVALHEAGLVHRDVKPANIVLTNDAGPVAARLIDFGLVTEVGRGGAALGTRGYLAPEVRDGSNRVRPHADIYALGCVLAECLTGIRGSSAGYRDARPTLSGGVADLLDRLTLRREAERPSARSACKAIDELLVHPARAALEFEAPRAVVAPRLVGRHADLQRLRAAWGAAQSGSRIVVLSGAPGSGKSTLAQAFGTEVRDTSEVLLASCHPRDPATFSVVRQLLDGYVLRAEQAADGAWRTERLKLLRDAAGDLGSIAKLVSPAVARVFRDAPGAPRPERADHVFVEGLATLLRRLLEKLGPTLVCIDDVQWMDAGSRRVLARILDQTEGLPCLYLFVARDDDQSVAAVDAVVEFLEPNRVARLLLSSLSEEEVLGVARAFLGPRDLDDDLRETLGRLSDGTPLGTLELLRVLLDEGALRPHWAKWRIDREAVPTSDLPRGATAALTRRIAGLAKRNQEMLQAAAVLGMSFEGGVVGDMIEMSADDVESRLEEMARAHLVEPSGPTGHRFVHHRVREALLGQISMQRHKALHYSAARAIDARLPSLSSLVEMVAPGAPSLEVVAVDVRAFDAVSRLYDAAAHYADADIDDDSQRVFDVVVAAARCALAAFDNQRAMHFFEVAERVGALSGRFLCVEDQYLLGETQFRIGAFSDCQRSLYRVARAPCDPMLQAMALARVAFVHELLLDSDSAWRALEAAFRRLGAQAPSLTVKAAPRLVWAWSTRSLRVTGPGARRRRSDELLCSLYYQWARLAVQAGAPGRLLASTGELLALAERLGPSPALVKAWLIYSFVLMALGLQKLGSEYVRRAEEVAAALGDPVAYSHALQVHGVAAIWGGRTEESVVVTARCLTEYGHWRELSDYYLTAYSQSFVEMARGRAQVAWAWLDGVLRRVNQSEGAQAIPEYLVLGARACLVAIGEKGTPLGLEALTKMAVPANRDSSLYAWTFDPRVRLFTEPMNLNADFEALVREVRARVGGQMRRLHLLISPFFIHVAHARVHQCLRAPLGEREKHMVELETALSDVRAAARIPLFHAHANAIEGYHAYLTGHPARAREWFQKAEALALSENAPWVMYAVYRGRAHMLRDEGRPDAARDQAKLAEHIAREHGAAYRVKFIREEFALDLSRPRLPGSAAVSEVGVTGYTMGLGSSRARRQLRALVRISQSRGTELDPDELARSMVDEVVRALRAQRGALYLDAELATASGDAIDFLGLVAARDVEERDLSEIRDRDDTVIRAAYAAGSRAEDGAPNGVESVESAIGTTARHATIAAPLTIGNRTMGVVYLDRDVGEGLFTAEDGDVLSVLAAQVGLGLELVETLVARERAEQGRRHAEKMDAMGRLAGGIAHDMKNMLAAIRDSTTGILESPWDRESVLADARTIQTATERAEELARQLGSFPSGDAGRREAVQLNDRISRLAPVLRGLLGDGAQLELSLVEPLSLVVMDSERLDQVVMNLVTNARDAMPSGGRVKIATREVKTEAEQPPRPAGLKGRALVELSVTDTGEGMSEGTREQVFDPYFTTKRSRGGTGLGLSTVYDVIHRAGGEVEVESGLGEGSTFRIRLPRGPARLPHRDEAPVASRGRETILVVTHDPATSQQTEARLVRLGYAVVTSDEASEARRIVERNQEQFDVVIVDASLPGAEELPLCIEALSQSPVLLRLSKAGIEERSSAEGGVTPSALARRVREALAGVRQPS